MATAYHPLPRNFKHKWLLSNGMIAEEPPLEASDSGRRIRVAGSSKSVYAKETDDLIFRAVQRAAEDIGERVWMNCNRTDPIARLNSLIGAPKPIDQPHFVTPQKTSYSGRSSVVSWTFRHKTLPISARITVTMSTRISRYNNSHPQHETTTTLGFLSTNAHDAREAVALTVNGETIPFGEESSGSYEYDVQRQRFADFVRDNPPNWLDLMGTQEFNNEREAAAGIARLCREIDSLDGIDIPDLRDPDSPAYLTLGLYETTFTRDFAQSIIDFLNGAPVVEQLQSHWNEMVNLFRRTGIVVDSLEETDFHAALNGEVDRLNVSLKNLTSPHDENAETSHIIGLNLLTGTVTVTCSIRDERDEDIATEYEIARIKAEKRGELDAFLGFKSGYLDTAHRKRHGRTVQERTVDIDINEVANDLGL